MPATACQRESMSYSAAVERGTGMRFRLFGWRRGARSFVREVAIIIVGVLIALALEQIVANWREARRVADMRLSMDEEIADFAEIFLLRAEASRCIVPKLDRIDRLLAEGGGRATDVGRPPFFFSSRGAWNSDAADLMARHAGPETYRIYGELYQGVEEFTALSQQEQDHWVVLQTLERQEGPVEGERRWRLAEAAAGARNANLLLSAIADQMLAHIRSLGVEPNRTLTPAGLRTRPLCRPLGTGGEQEIAR